MTLLEKGTRSLKMECDEMKRMGFPDMFVVLRTGGDHSDSCSADPWLYSSYF